MPINPPRLNNIKLCEENGSGNKGTLKAPWLNLEWIKNQDMRLFFKKVNTKWHSSNVQVHNSCKEGSGNEKGMKRIMNPMAWYQDYSRLFCGLTQWQTEKACCASTF